MASLFRGTYAVASRIPEQSLRALWRLMHGSEHVRRLQRGHLYFGAETWQIEQRSVKSVSPIVCGCCVCYRRGESVVLVLFKTVRFRQSRSARIKPYKMLVGKVVLRGLRSGRRVRLCRSRLRLVRKKCFDNEYGVKGETVLDRICRLLRRGVRWNGGKFESLEILVAGALCRAPSRRALSNFLSDSLSIWLSIRIMALAHLKVPCLSGVCQRA